MFRSFSKLARLSSLCLFIALIPAQSMPLGPADGASAASLFQPGATGPVSGRLRFNSEQADIALAQLDDSQDRARRGDFDATDMVSCAQERGQSLGNCKAAVSRGSGGATVVVTFPNGFARQLYFEGEAFVRASTTMSGSGKDVDWSLEDGLYTIRVDDQRFEISARFVLGE
ncbi:MAG: hypothetical protein AAGE80_13160 [Pseudomonadota bacterium]